jgi:hypothetical protein
MRGEPPAYSRRRVFLAVYRATVLSLSCRHWLKGESGRGDRYCEVVQRDQGIWIYSTRSRWQRRVCTHLGRGKSRPEQPQRQFRHNDQHRIVRTVSASLFLAAGQIVVASNEARAQAVQPTPTLDTKINQLRLNARVFNPEHGEVLLETLGKLDFGADKYGLELNRYISVFVSDVDTTKAIKFSDVMNQLVKQSSDNQLSKEALFHQWWDTAGQGPGLELGPHCDDSSAPMPSSGIANNTATTSFNLFAYRCPRLEKSEASSDPFTKEGEVDPQGKDVNQGGYTAIAFSNRFDLGPPVPSTTSPGLVEYPDCGEYRIVFARNSGKTDPLTRNLIIFEARVANPDRKPEKVGHPNGCLPMSAATAPSTSGLSPAMARALAATQRALSAGNQTIATASGLKPTAITTPPVPALMLIALAPEQARYRSAGFVSGDLGTGLATVATEATSATSSSICDLRARDDALHYASRARSSSLKRLEIGNAQRYCDCLFLKCFVAAVCIDRLR